MDLLSSHLVQPLALAEAQFLQVLLTRFELGRSGGGVHLHVAFDDQTPAIWNRHARYAVRQAIDNFESTAARYQKQLDAFLLDGEGENHVFDDPGFPFRWGNAGTLPVLSWRGKDYYALFYREIPPIGWNIANGGCRSRVELMDPTVAMGRELTEELLILDPVQRRRYGLHFGDGAAAPSEELNRALALWDERLVRSGFPERRKWHEDDVSAQWTAGPDSVTVRMSETDRTLAGVFLNINAEDFGIEIDGIAHLDLADDAVVCEGEIVQGCLVNSPVGLFECSRLNEELTTGRDFRPDAFFFDGRLRDPAELGGVIADDFFPALDAVRSAHERQVWQDTPDRYDLCPVTRRIIQRYVRTHRPGC